jgi:hypothetical protein
MILLVIIFVLLAAVVTYLYYPKTQASPALPIQTADQAPVEDPIEKSTAYDGLLWLKSKYEQDREQATAKYMSLKAEHLELREKYAGLQEQLQYEMQRSSDIKGKLESSGELLLRLHAQLDQLLTKNNIISSNELDSVPADTRAADTAAGDTSAGNPGSGDPGPAVSAAVEQVVAAKAPRSKSKKLIPAK